MSIEKQTIFKGVATALITPFYKGEIDYESLQNLIERQIDAGVGAILLAGTTGESPTLSVREHAEMVSFAARQIDGRLPLLAGCGSNSTAHACELAKAVAESGADALLAVTPYYNRTNDRGIVAHYHAIANATQKPLILYNVPARTGFSMTLAHYRELSEHPNIVGLKEATGNMAQMVEIMHLCGDKIDVYSGEDALTVPMMAMGAAGTISVLSNVLPKESVAMTDACKAGDFKTAAKMQADLLPLINALFSEVNPIPAKAAVAAMGFGEEHLRMPLSKMEDATRAKMYDEMRKLGINV